MRKFISFLKRVDKIIIQSLKYKFYFFYVPSIILFLGKIYSSCFKLYRFLDYKVVFFKEFFYGRSDIAV